MLHAAAGTAQKLKDLLIQSSSLIEEYTGQVCPECRDRCCRQKHGVFRERDIIYLSALGIDVPPPDDTASPEAPCRFLEAAGCVRPRWLRPFKCTWYFCGPLLTAMNEGPQKKARTLSMTLQKMIRLFDELGNERNENHGQSSS